MTQADALSKFYNAVLGNRRTSDAGAELANMVSNLLDDVEIHDLLPILDCYSCDLSAAAYDLYRKLLAI